MDGWTDGSVRLEHFVSSEMNTTHIIMGICELNSPFVENRICQLFLNYHISMMFSSTISQILPEDYCLGSG